MTTKYTVVATISLTITDEDFTEDLSLRDNAYDAVKLFLPSEIDLEEIQYYEVARGKSA